MSDKTEHTKKTEEQQSAYIDDLIFKATRSIRRFGWCVVVLACIGALLNLGWSYYKYKPKYEASASFTISVDVASGHDFYNNATATQMAATFPYILTGSPLMKIVSKSLDREVTEEIKAQVLEGTNMFTIKVTSSTPQGAYDVLLSVITNYPKVAQYIIGSTRISITVSPSVTPFPINLPNYRTQAIRGALVGGMLGMGVILLYMFVYSTIRKSDDINQNFNCKCIGTIGEIETKKRRGRKGNTIISIFNPLITSGFRESVNSLRNMIIRECRAHDLHSIVITSTTIAEGKTTVAANLAFALSKRGNRVILVDCDLRRPSVQRRLSVTGESADFAKCLTGEMRLEDVIFRIRDTEVDALCTVTSNAKAAELVNSKRMKAVIGQLRQNYDYVVIDTPPAGLVSDASAMAEFADALLYVIRYDYAHTAAIGEALENFSGSDVYMLGCVLNRASGAFSEYRYGYYGRYGKYGKSRYGYGYGYGSYGYGSHTAKKNKNKKTDSDDDTEDAPDMEL